MTTLGLPLPLLALGAGALLLTSVASAQSSAGLHVEGPVLRAGPGLGAGLPAARVSPELSAGATPPPGSADGLGRYVDVHLAQTAISNGDTVRISQSGVGVLTNDLFAGSTISPSEIFDVAIGNDVVYVGAVDPTFPSVPRRVYRSTFDGTSWSTIGSFTFASDSVQFDVFEGFYVHALQLTTAVQLVISGEEDAGLTLASSDLLAGREVVAIAVGRDVTGTELAILVTYDDGLGARIVESYVSSGGTTSIVEQGVVASGTTADDFGADVAIDDGYAWIGVPGFDGFATDAGQVQLWVDDGAGNFSSGGAISSGQPNDFMGRSVDAREGIVAFGEKEADIVAGGSSGVGAVRLVRFDGGSAWTVTGEIYHVVNNEFSTPRDLGASVALGGFSAAAGALGNVVMGAPGGGVTGGGVSIRPVFASAVTESNLSSGLAGSGGVSPWAAAFGATFNNAPVSVELGSALPSSTAFLILGFSEVNLPLKGGVLFPDAFFVKALPVDAFGGLQLLFPWQSQPGPAYSVALQFWIQDPGAVAGFSATPGLRITEN